jgi:hypothetical protein
MYEFDKNISAEDIKFFGQNEGEPWYSVNSSGMLDGRKNVLTYPCNEVNKTVPYFKEFTPHNFHGHNAMSDYIASVIKSFSETQLDFNDREYKIPELANLPDGAFKVRQANPQKLDYNLQVNDLKYWQYHRNNGITKIGVYDNETNSTFFNLRQIEGTLTIADIINQAYMRNLFNDTTVVGGVQFFPFTPNFESEMNKGLSIICLMVLPLCMSMSLPVFIY